MNIHTLLFKILVSVIFVLSASSFAETKCKKSNTTSLTSKKRVISWAENFDKCVKDDGVQKPKNWVLKGTKWGVNNTQFSVKKSKQGNSYLNISANKATGTYLYSLKGKVDLNKTPILRWRWRAKKLPKGADGRPGGKDDQAIAVYIGTGSWTQNSVAYRWETETPKKHEGKISYAGGLVSVKWFCLRNKKDKLNKWYIEEVDIAKAFKKAYKSIPKAIGITIVSNSQYTGTQAEADIDWIEFSSHKTSVKVIKKKNNLSEKKLITSKKKSIK